MKSQSGSKKNIIIGAVIIIVAAIVYFYFSGSTPSTTSSTSTLQTQNANNVVGARVLSLLNQIRSLKIDTSIFKGAAYQSLVDYSVAIPEVPVGRPNPFAPIPGVPVTPSSGTNAAR